MLQWPALGQPLASRVPCGHLHLRPSPASGSGWCRKNGAVVAVALAARLVPRVARRQAEASEAPASPPEGLEQAARRIAAQLRKAESVLSACGQAYELPAKSNPKGLTAINDLENLISDSDLDDKEKQALVSSLRQDKNEFVDIQAKSLKICRGEKEDPTGFSEDVDKITTLLDKNGYTQGEKESTTWPLPPSESDSSPNAQNARYPVLEAVEQSCHGRTLGLAESELFSTKTKASPKEMKLLDLLQRLEGLSSHMLGESTTSIRGVVDVIERARPQDALLVEVDADDLDDEFLMRIFSEADAQGISAVVLLADSHKKWKALLEKSFQDFHGTNLKATVILPKTERQEAVSLRLVREFLGSSNRALRKIAVVGQNDLEVRSASWLLFKMLEMSVGASKTGFINDRFSMIAQSNLGICGRLTACAVEEILCAMEDAELDVCVCQVLGPGSFDHLDFDLVLHLEDGDFPSSERITRPQNAAATTGKPQAGQGGHMDRKW